MSLYRCLSPELVLCQRCRDDEDHSERIAAYVNEDDGALLLREVCAAQDCPELQVRRHLCVEHILEFELAWQNQIPVRSCHGCRHSVLKLYAEKQQVWFILAYRAETAKMRGVETRLIDREAPEIEVFQSPAGKKKRKTPVKRVRRSARTLRQTREKERMRALEWSLGNVQVKSMFLWTANKRRLDAERSPAVASAELDIKSMAPTEEEPVKQQPSRPEPLDVFCEAPNCQRYAKTNRRCRFHNAFALPPWEPIARSFSQAMK